MKKLILIYFAIQMNQYILGKEQSSRGVIQLESRYFKNDHNIHTVDKSLSLYSEIETKGNLYKINYNLGGFGRVDRFDNDRNILEFQDFYLQKEFKMGRITAGYNIFNWSSLETFHPTDVINSRNYDGNIDTIEKLGELALNYNYIFNNSTFDLFYFPRAKDPKFVGSQSRFSRSVRIENPIYHNSKNRASFDNKIDQFGVRYSQIVDNLDYSVYFLKIVDRVTHLLELQFNTVNLIPSLDTTRLQPHLFISDQVGGSLDWDLTQGTMLKFEFASKNFKKHDLILTNFGYRTQGDYTQSAAGVEKLFVFENAHELLMTLEYQIIFGQERWRRDEISTFQNDMSLTFTYSFNDILSKRLMFSFISDFDGNDESLYSIKYDQRLNDYWKIKISGLYIDTQIKGPSEKGLEIFYQDHHIQFILSRYL